MSTRERFDLTGPLPSGTTVIEASAGTGKTYALAGLAARYVAEGLAELPQLMLVTFGRAATQELRERTRTRLAETAAALADPERARAGDDQLVTHLAGADDETVGVRRLRLLRALSDFDAATIATTHGFCQQMLAGLGIAGEREPDTALVESADDIAEEVISDLYLAEYSDADPDLLPLREARAAALAAIRDSQAHLAPADADSGGVAGRRVAFAAAARAEVERRKRRRGIRDFDDLLVLLRDTLAHPVHGPAACQRVRERFRVVLVDEFQDTDPVQWEVLRLAFHEHVSLVLVGDPKQAIYAFRGAEVLAYLDAVRVAGEINELDVNWRSDAGLLTALERVFADAALGHPEIVAHPVAAAGDTARLPGTAPLRLRYLDRTGCGPQNRSGFPAVAKVRQRIATDLADDVVALLDGEPTLLTAGGRRGLIPSDIAVLVRNRNQIALVRDALHDAGVPCVQAGGTSVFATPAAQAWLRLLQGIEHPHRPARVRLAALTPLIGVSAADLDAGGDELVDELSGLLRGLGATFAEAGIAAMVERLAARTGMAERILCRDTGERMLTDIRHLAQLLNRAATAQSLGVTALIRWLSARMSEDHLVTSADRSRLLDRDSTAVHIVTIHASKGLEYPVVYLPFGWDGGKPPEVDSLLLHSDGERIRDVGGKGGPGYRTREVLHRQEEAGEDLRLLYVALTRAMCRVVAWWAPTLNTKSGPLHRLVLGRSTGAEPSATAAIPGDADIAARLADWARPTGDAMSVEPVPRAAAGRRWQPPVEPDPELAVATFTRSLDLSWRRTSYTALTAAAHGVPGVGSEAEEPVTVDEPATAVPTAPASAETPTASLMNDLPAGPEFGTLVHAILEEVDTAAPDLAAEVRLRCAQATARRLSSVDVDALATALTAAMTTPIGEGTLADVAPGDRLDELEFELPVTSTVSVSRIAELIRTHLPAGDPLAGYADLLGTLTGVTHMRGFLTGSIDAVLRREGPDGPRFTVVDYKTNRLATGPVDATHYSQQAMAAEMLRAHYALQALLYLVALHRYLRWRLPGYDPRWHLSGAQYLFVRGMIGPDTPPGCGVFTWTPPAALVIELSDLLGET
ncbi:MAG: AAA family ATPase [Actinophytocola sp.]|nr:AAA family ATPase [Actinophytocola sp.]